MPRYKVEQTIANAAFTIVLPHICHLRKIQCKKFKKIGSGKVYDPDNASDLLDRLKLLGGSILAGNDAVKNEFSQIVHTLNRLGVLNNNQLNNI